jgi:hypothetical protein
MADENIPENRQTIMMVEHETTTSQLKESQDKADPEEDAEKFFLEKEAITNETTDDAAQLTTVVTESPSNANDLEPKESFDLPTRPLKRARTAYFIFADDKRPEIQKQVLYYIVR